jgi:hypothetical protein
MAMRERSGAEDDEICENEIRLRNAQKMLQFGTYW